MVRVLTVDDNAPFLRVAHDLVSATEGFESAGEESSPNEALAKLEQQSPDLLLLDVHMPGMTGIEFARRVSERPDPPVVVLISAVDPANLPAAAHECGAAAVISKHELAPSRLRELWIAHGGDGPDAALHEE